MDLNLILIRKVISKASDARLTKSNHLYKKNHNKTILTQTCDYK